MEFPVLDPPMDIQTHPEWNDGSSSSYTLYSVKQHHLIIRQAITHTKIYISSPSNLMWSFFTIHCTHFASRAARESTGSTFFQNSQKKTQQIPSPKRHNPFSEAQNVREINLLYFLCSLYALVHK